VYGSLAAAGAIGGAATGAGVIVAAGGTGSTPVGAGEPGTGSEGDGPVAPVGTGAVAPGAGAGAPAPPNAPNCCATWNPVRAMSNPCCRIGAKLEKLNPEDGRDAGRVAGLAGPRAPAGGVVGRLVAGRVVGDVVRLAVAPPPVAGARLVVAGRVGVPGRLAVRLGGVVGAGREGRAADDDRAGVLASKSSRSNSKKLMMLRPATRSCRSRVSDYARA
jgi:hypothetical protein